MDVNGIAAVVTGGGSGMGAETARQLARAGAKVALLDVNQAQAEAVAAEIGGLAIPCDVTSADGVAEALDRAAEAHGPARLAVNCAGVATAGRIVGREGPLDLAHFRRVVEINLIGTFNVLRLAAARMQGLAPLADGERGLVVNTASIAAYEGQVGQAAYAASKGGIVSLTLPAAREFARMGVRVVTIAPGLIETPLFANLDAKAVESLVAQTVFPQRLGLPAEFARLVLHVAENIMINGETIRMDGAVRLAIR